jgi:hypothetical protein
VLQGPRQARLDEEALAEVAIGGEARGEQLQRKRAVEGDVVRAVDDAHAATAQHLLEPVAGDLGGDARVEWRRQASSSFEDRAPPPAEDRRFSLGRGR